MIRVRNDDVLMHWNWKKTIHYSNIKDPVTSFKTIHEIISSCEKMIHVPSILCRNIQEFPEAIPFIRKETEVGRMTPEIHGWEHVDYAKYTYDGACKDLKLCTDFMERFLGVKATKWYTPWGANNETIQKAGESFGLEVIDCSKVIRPWDAGKRDNIEVFMHWWEGIENILNLVEELENG